MNVLILETEPREFKFKKVMSHLLSLFLIHFVSFLINNKILCGVLQVCAAAHVCSYGASLYFKVCLWVVVNCGIHWCFL